MIKHLLVALFITTMTTFAYSLGTIEGIVWLDDNADGIKDLTEGGINAVSVSLIDDATGLQVGANQLTNFSGAYSFANLAPGSYYVRFNTPFPNASHRVSPMNVGGDDTVDSDAATTNPHVTSAEIKVITANEIFDDVFMGLFLAADINGIVWHDINGNGQRDGGDGVCPQNVNVTLFDNSTGLTVTTNASGGPLTNPVNTNNTYQFQDLPPGDYYVEFSEPGGSYPTGLHLTLQQVGAPATDSDPDRVTGQSDVIALNGVNVTNIDAGYFLVGQVGDFVWEDLNGDGQQGGTEPGLGGISVELVFAAGGTALDVDGNPLGAVNTTAAGSYIFDQVPPGTYQVQFEVNPVAASGNTLYFTQQNIGPDATDSDANKTTGLSEPSFVIVSAGPENIDIDAGYYQKCTISDFTWHDLNGNGIQDGGEPGLDVGIVITKLAPAGPFNEVDGVTAYIPGISSAGGAYIYDNLPPGEYKLTFAKPANYFFTLQNAGSGTDDSDPDRLTGMTVNITCNSGDELDEYDAGFFTKCTIGDFVWHDEDGDGVQGGEPGLGGIEIIITDVATGNPVTLRADGTPYVATIASAGSGAYIFDNLPPGEYKLTFSDPAAVYQLTLWEAGGDNTRDNDADIMNGGMTRDLTCNSEDVLVDIDAGFFTKATLKGVAWHDSDGDGLKGGTEPFLENVTITLLTLAGGTPFEIDGVTPVAPQVTNASGDYQFNNLRPGTYTMTANLPGWLFTLPLVSGGADDSEFDINGDLVNDVLLISNQIKTDINVGLYKLITLSGNIWGEDDLNSTLDPGETGGNMVAVTLCRSSGGMVAQTVADVNGRYEFTDIIPGDYIVKIDASNFVSGAPLYGLSSCDGQGGDDDTDNDDNGDGPNTGPITTVVIKLYCGQEPGTDGVINETVDFCFKADCGTPNALTVPSCGTITDTICDLNILGILCSRMPPPPLVGPAPGQLCANGGVPHNMSWFAFVAGGGVYDLQIDIFGCAGGQNGAQIGLLEIDNCDFGSAVEIFCIGNPCVTGIQTISSALLTPGKTYYLWLDGCSGSVCSYEINILGNFIQYQIPEIVDIECSSSFGRCDTICPGNTITFEAKEDYDNLTGKFRWRITDPMGIVTNVVTVDRFLNNYSFTQLGVYKVALIAIEVKCSLPISPFEIEVVVANPKDEDWGVWPVCQNDLALGWVPLTVFNESTTDPNGDGEAGWFGPDIFTQGKKSFNVTTPKGCAHKQNVEIIRLLNSTPYQMDTFLCPGQTIEVGPYDIKNETYPPLNLTFPNAAGCDSIVDVAAIFLQVDGYIEDLGCFNNVYQIQYVQTAVSNNPLSQYLFTYKYVWTDEFGNVVNDGDPDGDPKTLIINKSGTYTVTVELTAKNTTCNFAMAPIVIDLGNLVPAQVTQASPWSNKLCENNAIVSYSINSVVPSVDILKYIWTLPATAKVIGKRDTSTITVDWTASTGGKICASVQTVCGISPPLCDSVVIVPIPIVTLPALADICVDKTVSITATTTDQPSYIYNWNFDSGNSATSTGPGPHLVSWGSEGIKNISLIINNQNCLSSEVKTTINVLKPEPVPVVICEGLLGQVVFTWPPVIGATGYVPTISTGQTGGNLTGNATDGFTFTLTGLGLFEQVDMILTINTSSPCGSLISNSGCFAQNCNPPDVTIDAIADICLTASTSTFNLNDKTNISPVSSQGGIYEYTGKGITDASTGKFDPKLADFGANVIQLKYTSPDQCIKFATVTINVYETPTADFKASDLIICQDSSVVIDYTGNVTAGGSFDWTFGNDVVTPGNGKGPFNLEWTTPGDKSISLIVTKDGCTSTPKNISVKVEPRVGLIDIKCNDQQPTEIIVGWDPVANIGNYTLLVNNVALPNTTNLTYTLSNLIPDSKHFFEVIANSNNSCPGSRDTVTCLAKNCPKVTITFDVNDTTICLNSSVKPFKITPSISGGLMDGTGVITWSGKGIDADGNFDPILAGPSTGAGHKITLSFAEGTCKEANSLSIRVLAQPKSDFTMPNKICIDDELDITYSGSNGVPFDWKTPAGVTITPNGIGKFKTKFAAPGDYKLGLIVGNAICPSDLVENTVKVEPNLDLLDIKCASTLNSVEFSWADIDCATKYEVIIDGVNKGQQTTLNFLNSNLAEGDMIKIEVTPISECTCPGVKVTKTCEAKRCPTITLALSTPKDKFCIGTETTPFQLVANVTGSNGTGAGKWSGIGVNATGLFDPKDLKEGVYTVKFEFREENCDFSETIDIIIYGKPVLSTLTTSPDCYQYNYGTAIPTITGGDGNYTYRLDGNAIVLDSLDKVAPGTHILIVNDGKGCNASTSFTITPAPSGEITIDGQAEILKGQITSFIATIKSIPGPLDSVVWTNSKGEVLCSGKECLTLANIKPDSTDTYCAKAYYNSGCYIDACIDQIVRPLIEIILPNIIKPGGTGNDGFFIQSYANIEIVRSMAIYDRWGNLVFSRENFLPGPDDSNTWDGTFNGKRMVPGVYVYTIDLVKKGGKEEKFNGDVTVVE